MKPFTSDDWLRSQSPAVQSEWAAWRRGVEEGEANVFLAALAAVGPSLPRGRLRLLYECWLAVPGNLAFAVACSLKRGEIERWTMLASKALLTGQDANDFECAHELGDPLEELESWLRNRVWRNQPGLAGADEV